MPRILNVLLVEDNPDDAHLTLRALRKFGPALLTKVAGDGQEALVGLLETDEPLPDVVLLDLHLPKVSGQDVLKRIRDSDRTSGLPVVVLRSDGEPDDVRLAYERLASASIHKPVTESNFLAVVQELGIEWGGGAE